MIQRATGALGGAMASGDILATYRKLYRKIGEEFDVFKRHEVGLVQASGAGAWLRDSMSGRRPPSPGPRVGL